jgi:hypothetical protein
MIIMNHVTNQCIDAYAEKKNSFLINSDGHMKSNKKMRCLFVSWFEHTGTCRISKLTVHNQDAVPNPKMRIPRLRNDFPKTIHTQKESSLDCEKPRIQA